MPGNLTKESVLDLRELKKKYGDRMCIFDHLNPNGNLLIGSSEDVARETKAHLEKARSMSGYIFSTSGTTSPVTPKENFEAMNREVINFELL
jgi:uroporphyrinogen decarboxylase